MDVYYTHATKLTVLVNNVRQGDGEVRVITYVYQIAHHVIPVIRVLHVWMNTLETRALPVTPTVLTRVIKTQAIARVPLVILMSTRTEVSVQLVTKIVTTKHAIPILEFVFRVAWMDTGEIIAIKRATTVV